ncbi:hypothetical protein ACEV6Q_00965 [Enterobacter ludwigii]|uniref:hypothetical protein n=1 Tax=Enterobacter ludwigii TaxID=299767 RepID=UPI003BEED0C7
MKIITHAVIAKSNIKFIDEAKADLYITASKKVIEKWIAKIDFKIEENRKQKYYFMQNNDDFASGTFLYNHCMLSTVKSIYLIFQYIKNDEGEKAWMSLIDAYDYLDVAKLFLDKYKLHSEGFAPFMDNLKQLEKLLFPTHHLFISPGAKETLGDCSVCGNSFFGCEHIEREIYNGILCQRINRRIIEANHVALVENPRDRRCIIVNIKDTDGRELNIFSRERTISSNEKSDHMIMNVILHNFQRPNFN